jgi:dephospho-CoA kinase
VLWIGLTGGIASGKSTVARLLRAKGFPVVDADVLAREVVSDSSSTLAEVAHLFGPQAITTDGQLDRKYVGRVVFSDPTKLQQLEAIVHPAVRKLTEKSRAELELQGHWVAFYDVPLLFEKNMKHMFDRVLLVMSSENLQRVRMQKRDGLEAHEIEKRLSAQLPLSQKRPLADDVIENEGSLQDLEASVNAYIAKLKKPV